MTDICVLNIVFSLPFLAQYSILVEYSFCLAACPKEADISWSKSDVAGLLVGKWCRAHPQPHSHIMDKS